ncbi:hypothetical protein ACGFJT_36940 [Actinomadura geliboluensis]|uniref:hypothetical protein n=1 Tax=Actinomadura geliboluensis TaxID=882440 RepID=UPI00371FE1E7
MPSADVSTNRWLDSQADISRSLKTLIRESIQRDGYIDVDNKPVEQLPRRGRPPQSETGEQHRFPRGQTLGVADTETGERPGPGAHEMDVAGSQCDPGIKREVSGADDSEESPADAADSKQLAGSSASASAPPADEPAAPGRAQAPRRQASIDEIMASTRR